MTDDVDPRKRHSAGITEGFEQAPMRAQLYAVGLTDEEMKRPIVGVANTWVETMPCNVHLRDLAAEVKRGIRDVGATALEFNTIAISDAVLSHDLMGASLISREVIADSIELATLAYEFDAVVAIGGCDKTNPACVMALARVNRPAVFLYGGSINPGNFRRHPCLDPGRRGSGGIGGVGRHVTRGPRRARAGRVPRCRHLRRNVHREHHGVGHRGARPHGAQRGRPAGHRTRPPRRRLPHGSAGG